MKLSKQFTVSMFLKRVTATQGPQASLKRDPQEGTGTTGSDSSMHVLACEMFQ